MRSNVHTGTRLKALRLNRGLSPEQLGARVGLSGMTIRRVEQGLVRPTARSMFLIAEEMEKEVIEIWPL